ncbi:MAG: hypothetical protein PVG65_00500 [Candidatus Thorarchaeota archaeon]|jgi:hypothetical protein
MKKLFIIVLMTFMLPGCSSILPRVTFDTPNTQPQSTEKSKAKYVCKGKLELNADGSLKSCSKGFYSYEENYGKKERSMTIVERVKSFINGLVGWGFWGIVLLVILCPSLVGLIAGRLIEGTLGIAKKSLNATVRAVQRTRKNGTNLNDALSSEQDEDVKKYIAKLKEKEKIK